MSAKVSRSSETLTKKTRLLLFLWDMGGKEIPKGKLTDRLKQKQEKAGDYQETFKELEEAGGIELSKNKVSLVSPKGLQMLDEGLKSDEFQFNSQIGAKTANALLRWLREQSTSGKKAESNGASAPAGKAKTAEGAIASYDEFKQVALDIYNRLNQDYNLNDLVPIYRIRHAIADRVSREHFNKWLLQMQENDIFQLMAGEMPDLTPDKREDSITIPGGGLRYYAKRLNS